MSIKDFFVKIKRIESKEVSEILENHELRLTRIEAKLDLLIVLNVASFIAVFTVFLKVII